jgi:hypothetical protein
VLPAAAGADNVNAAVVDGLSRLVQNCWAPDPDFRPEFVNVEFALDALVAGIVLNPESSKH